MPLHFVKLSPSAMFRFKLLIKWALWVRAYPDRVSLASLSGAPARAHCKIGDARSFSQENGTFPDTARTETRAWRLHFVER